MIQTLPALRFIMSCPNPLQHFSHIALNIVLNGVDLKNILPDVIVLDICNLGVFIPLLE